MAPPTFAQAVTMLQNAVDLLEETRKYGVANTSPEDNFVTLQATLVANLIGDFTVEKEEAVASMRSQVDSILRSSQDLLNPVMRDFGGVISSPQTDALAILVDLYDFFVDNTHRVQGRVIAYGTPTATSANLGDGIIHRLTVDAQGFNLEGGHVEAKTAIVEADQSTGTEKHEEIFRFEGADPPKDGLELGNSGSVLSIGAYSARDSLLSNPSFSDFDGTIALPTDIVDWTVASGSLGTTFQINDVDTYRSFAGEDTDLASVRVLGNGELNQSIEDAGVTIDPDTPYYLQIAYREINAPTSGAQLRIHLGTNSAAITFPTGVSTWQVLRMPIGQNNWYERFLEDDLDVRFVTSGFGSGDEILVDEILLVPYVAFDGTWYCPVGGRTPWLLDEDFAWTDTATESKIQRWLHFTYGTYLPHATDSTIDVADP